MILGFICKKTIKKYKFLTLALGVLSAALSFPHKANAFSCLETCVLSSQCGKTEYAQVGRAWCRKNCGMTGCGIIALSINEAESRTKKALGKAFSKLECASKCSSKTLCNKSKSISLKCKTDCPTTPCGKIDDSDLKKGKMELNQISPEQKDKVVLGAKILESLQAGSCNERRLLISLNEKFASENDTKAYDEKEKNDILGDCKAGMKEEGNLMLLEGAASPKGQAKPLIDPTPSPKAQREEISSTPSKDTSLEHPATTQENTDNLSFQEKRKALAKKLGAK